MKKQKLNKIAFTKKINATTFLYLSVCSIVILTMSCKKSNPGPAQSNTAATQQLNTQEQILIGKWKLKKNERHT